MKTVSKRELNQQTARVLAGVRDGDAVIVTERGVPRWRIEPVDADATTDPVELLRARGMLTPASKNPPPWPDDWDDDVQQRTPAEVDALYQEMRGDH